MMRRVRSTPRRGYVLLLVLALISAAAIGGVVAFDRVGAARVDDAQLDHRIALLWIARSAALRRQPGMSRVSTARGDVDVKVELREDGLVATARGGDGFATISVERGEWIERFTRFGDPRR